MASALDVEPGEPQLDGQRRLAVLADEQCLYHCIAASLGPGYYEALPMQRKIGAAYYIKGKFLEFVQRKGMEDDFLRLSGRGHDSYRTGKDFHVFAEFMGGSLLVSHEGGEEVGLVHFGPDGVPVAPYFLVAKARWCRA